MTTTRVVEIWLLAALIVSSAVPGSAQQPCRGAGYIDGITADLQAVERVAIAEASIQRDAIQLELMNGTPLCIGDAIATSERITIRLRLSGSDAGEQECTVGPGTRIELTEPESLFLRLGRVFMALRGRFDVVTSFARLGARGTEFQVEVTESAMDVVQIEGSLDVIRRTALNQPDGSRFPDRAIPDLHAGFGAAFRPHRPLPAQRNTGLHLARMAHLRLRSGEEPRITETEESLFRRIVDRDSRVYATTRPSLPSVNTVRTFGSREERDEVYRQARFRTLWDPANPANHEQLGDAYADWADSQKAITSYQKSSGRERSRHALALFYNNCGNVHRFNGDTRRAEAYYRQALQLDATFAFPYNGLGDVFRERAALEFERGNTAGGRRLLGTARAFYEKSLEPSRWGKEGGHNRAVPLHSLGETFLLEAENSGLGPEERIRLLRDAEDRYRQAAGQDPGYAFPLVGIGRVFAARARLYRELNRREEEAREIERGRVHSRAVADRYAGFAPARVQAGEILELAGDAERAAAEFLAATRADPGYAGAYFRAGVTLEKLGMSREALGYLQTYVRVERPDLVKTRRARDATDRIVKLRGAIREAHK